MGHLARGRALVQAALAALDVFEVLDGVGDVDARCARCRPRPMRAVEELAGGADEGAALEVFLVARLLADEGDGGADRPLAEHGAGTALDHRLAGGDHPVQGLEAVAAPGRASRGTRGCDRLAWAASLSIISLTHEGAVRAALKSGVSRGHHKISAVACRNRCATAPVTRAAPRRPSSAGGRTTAPMVTR